MTLTKKLLITILLLSLTGCVRHEMANIVNFNEVREEKMLGSAAPNVGDTAGGGIVYQVIGDIAYVSRTTNDSTSATWGCYGTAITGADSTTDGAQNTADIVAGCSTDGIAARLCSDLSSGGYTDWYLPAKDQLNTMYGLKNTIGNFGSEIYWTSTEPSINPTTKVWIQYFIDGSQSQSGGKNGSHPIRCVREYIWNTGGETISQVSGIMVFEE